MFRTLRSIALFAITIVPTCLVAQTTYWGMTANGGASNIGTIYSITEANVFTKKYDFFRYEGGNPKGDLIKASNGKYYGVTEFGGANGVGVLFSYDPTTSTYAILVNFSTLTTTSAAIGARPIRGLIQSPDNSKLYGMCSKGGLNDLGTFFDYNITTSTFTKRFDFDALTGAGGHGSTPRGRLVRSAANILYGVTQLGGANGQGAIFQFNTSTNVYTRRFDFAALPSTTTGAHPYSGMILGADGFLYGTAQIGGVNASGGVLFKFHPTTFAFTSLYDFTSLTGKNPFAELVQASSGVLYGTTSAGGSNNVGVIFSYTIGTDTYADLQDFTNAIGYSPFGRLIIASNGLMYGATTLGGTSNTGVIYSYNIGTDAYSVVYNLADGGYTGMQGGLLEDPVGNLVGLATDGGAGASGSMIKYNIASSTTAELVPFSFSNGSTPDGRLIKASNGLFYGMTTSGGTTNEGILFSLDPTTLNFTRLFNFGGTNGTVPQGTMTEVSGKLYGLCNNGGGATRGTLFEYNIASNIFTKKIDLTGSTGSMPQKGLFKAGNGKLYGMTSADGANLLGTLFEYVPGTNTFTKLRDFAAADGTTPLCDLIQGTNGLLYGTMSANGTLSNGTLFSFNTTTNTFTKLYNFDGLQGGAPAGDLVELGGKLYGMCREGGLYFNGSIFSWTIASSTYTEEYDMLTTPSEGKLSQSNLILGTDGLLYGTCAQGGTSDLGTLFRYNTVGPIFTVLQNFAGTTNGQYPFDGLAREVIPVSSLQVNPRVFLDGPYDLVSGLMGDGLRSLVDFPLTEPFTTAGFTQVGGGGETIAASVLSGATSNNAIVDWVLVELRDKTVNTTILRTQAALLQRDGDVVALDGTSTLNISMPADLYYVAIRQRNHFGVMTASSVSLSSTAVPLDFTTGALATYGTNPQKIVGSARVNWAGNVVRNTVISYTGGSNDRDPILVRVGGTVPTNTAIGYYAEDVNLDGVVKYTGSSNDRDPILVNIGGTVPTNYITEQLP